MFVDFWFVNLFFFNEEKLNFLLLEELWVLVGCEWFEVIFVKILLFLLCNIFFFCDFNLLLKNVKCFWCKNEIFIVGVILEFVFLFKIFSCLLVVLDVWVLFDCFDVCLNDVLYCLKIFLFFFVLIGNCFGELVELGCVVFGRCKLKLFIFLFFL